MSEPLIAAAKHITGKILAGNPYMTNSAKSIMNMINNTMYRR